MTWRERERLRCSLALVFTEQHIPELLEALPDRVDIGKVLIDHLTVWIVVCRERERERERGGGGVETNLDSTTTCIVNFVPN